LFFGSLDLLMPVAADGFAMGELSPLAIAALLAFVALNEVPRESLYAGAALIIVGLCFSNELIRLGSKASVHSTE
jgi:drug/metabolite transporter (DMT)-like permease